MTRWTTLAFALVVTVPATALAEIKDGYWRLAQMPNAAIESPICLLKVETKDGKASATVVDTPELPPAKKGAEPQKLDVKLGSFQADGKQVRIAVEVRGAKQVFEAAVDGADAKVMRGSLGDERRVGRATLTRQDGEKLEAVAGKDRPRMPEPYLAASKLNTAPLMLRVRAQRSQDANEKAELLAKAKEAAKEAEEKTPGLYGETVAKHADSPYAVEAALSLLQSAGKRKAAAEDVAAWMKVIDAEAAKYGPRFARETAIRQAESLNTQKGYEPQALAAATKGAEGVAEKGSLHVQSRALRALRTAQAAAGKDQEAKATDAVLAPVETALDEEYLKTVPPFKPEKYTGRKDRSANRVAVMELFTGATCPPCVAADAAFDALEMTYDPKDVVLIQYHVHIPGPDPMTNPDTLARWDFYRQKFEEEIGGVPSTLFNGKPQAGGGGGMPAAERKYAQYREIIDPILETKSDVTVTGGAKRSGSKIDVAVKVDGPKDVAEKAKLRVLLVEEKVRYAGSNGMRFHHRVVRAMRGGTGEPLTWKAGAEQSVSFDLNAIKAGLVKYLDEYAAERPFANPDRPLELAHRKVVALVQNDDTGEILNAAEFAVDGK